MDLITTLALSLGPAIAKSILKIWLKDQEIAQDLSSTLVELLGGKVKDVVVRQHAKRQFEAAGEKIATSLLPIFEDANLSDDGLEAVTLAVAGTLNSTKITPAILAQRNLDPFMLTRYLLDMNKERLVGLSKVELEFYQRVLSQSATYIVDIASLLPTFTERTLGEVLKREREIIDATNMILEEVRRIRKESLLANIEEISAQFEEMYRRSIARILDRPDIFGLDNISRASQRYRISVAYINLSVIHKQFVPTDRNSKKLSTDNNAVTVHNRQNVDRVLARTRRLIVRGQPGSGKTTLLKWIAVNSSTGSFDDSLVDWNNTVPFFIPLRRCVDIDLPAPEEFIKFIAPEIAGTMPKQWVHNCLNSGRAIVLVDGVDEIPQSQRSDVHDWLEGLVATYQHTRFIVSSRPPAIGEGWLSDQHFDEADFQPMEMSDIHAFIDHWHQAIRMEVEDEDDKPELDDLASNLKEIVVENRPLYNLATNPLLCAAICALHRDRHRQVPSNRIEIYEALCQMLLELREKERRLTLEGKDYPRLSYSQKRVLLEDLAYWMIRNRWTTVEIEEATRQISRKLKNIVGLSEITTASSIVRLFIDRSGIVREPVVGHLDFVHRTIEEFLAAKAALDNGDIGVLCNNAHDDQWQQVIILAVGLANPRAREQIIRGIIQRGDKERSLRHKFYLLAVACLENIVELSTALQEDIKRRLSDVVPPKNENEARAVALAGDLAVPFLIYNGKSSEEESAVSVLALSMVGTDAAFNALRTYTQEDRQSVIAELIKARESFDKVTYLREVISYLTVNNLSLTSMSSLEFLDAMPKLSSLVLTDSPKIKNLNTLNGLRNLDELHITKVGISDVDFLAGLPNLLTLSVDSCEDVKDLDYIDHLKYINVLILRNLPEVADLQKVSNLSDLVQLELSGLPKLNNLRFLSDLYFLDQLFLCDLPEVRDLTPISRLISLSSLKILSLTQVQDIGPLADLPGLVALYLDLDKVTDIRPLLKLPNLRELRLGPKFEGVEIPQTLSRINLICEWKSTAKFRKRNR